MDQAAVGIFMSERPFRKPCLILNPKAGSGRAQRAWHGLRPLLKDALGHVELRLTEAPNHATELTREALAGGADLVIATGGDGTVNEVLNGYLADGKAVSPDACLALIPLGTGGDFARSAEITKSPADAVRAIRDRKIRRMDAARVRLADPEGQLIERYFINVTSFGMGGEVSVSAKNNFLTHHHGRAAFLWATVFTFLRFRAKTVRLELDGQPMDEQLQIMQVAIGNGGYQGGGMLPCPLAKLDSGCLDLTVIEKIGLIDFLLSLRLLYSGTIYSHPKCHHFRVKHASATSRGTVLAEVDGEAVGGLPLQAEILPAAVAFAGLSDRI